MGNTPSSTPLPSVPSSTSPKDSQTPSPSISEPTITSKPFHHSKDSNSTSKDSLCPVVNKNKEKNKSETIVKSESSLECPVKTYKNPNIYNVYSQKIDPTNNMPAKANQQPAENQKMKLTTERIPSSIPKAGTDNETWLYPSPQMFWNALVRKQKTEDASEEYMDTVVAIHNNMNENTWLQVLAWEDIHKSESSKIIGGEPKLLRFTGRPDELSPKARLKVFLGNSPPFDRHDWIVDRGGKEVRYVIDYYHDEDGVGRDKLPQHLKDNKSLESIKVDVRPALDSLEAITDRLMHMPLLKIQGKTTYNPPPLFLFPKSSQVYTASTVSTTKDTDFTIYQETMTKIQSQCENQKMALKNCKGDVECAGASIKLQTCVASIICPDIVNKFNMVVKNSNINGSSNGNTADIDKAYGKVSACLDDFHAKSSAVLKKATA